MFVRLPETLLKSRPKQLGEQDQERIGKKGS
jgi:hypothetical protein